MNPEDLLSHVRQWIVNRIRGQVQANPSLPNQTMLPGEPGGAPMPNVVSREVHSSEDPRIRRSVDGVPTGRVDFRDPAPTPVAPGGPMNVVDYNAPPALKFTREQPFATAQDTAGTPVMQSTYPPGTQNVVGGIPVVVGPPNGSAGNVYRLPNPPPSLMDRARIAAGDILDRTANGADAIHGRTLQPGGVSPGQTPPTSIAAPVIAGNIDVSRQPQVRNPDGSISTVRTISIGVPSGEVVIPTVHPSGRIMTDEEAIREYQRTGRHLGVFRTPEEATAFAQRLHASEAQRIQANSPRVRDQIERLRAERNRRQ